MRSINWGQVNTPSYFDIIVVEDIDQALASPLVYLDSGFWEIPKNLIVLAGENVRIYETGSEDVILIVFTGKEEEETSEKVHWKIDGF